MADTIRYINTASTAGGDGTTNATTGANRAYATAQEWEAAEGTDVTATAGHHIVYCDGAGGDDTSALSVGGWTTNASHRIIMQQNPDGTLYRRAANSPAVDIGVDYIIVDGVDLSAQDAAGGYNVVNMGTYAPTPGSNLAIIRNCIGSHILTNFSGSYGVYAYKANRNCIVENCAFNFNGRGIESRTAASFLLYYSVFNLRANGYGILSDANTVIKNSAMFNSGTVQCFWSSGTTNGSNNASDDATATTQFSSSLANVVAANTFVSVTAYAEDLHLQSGSVLEGAGIPIAGYTTDLEGLPRDASTPDIGAYEYGAVAPPTGILLPFMMHNYY
jgi:hypothetical protein